MQGKQALASCHLSKPLQLV